MNIIYFVDNKQGGVTTLNYNLIANSIDGIHQSVIFIGQEESAMVKADVQFPAKMVPFEYSSKDNYYHTLKRLYQLLPGSAEVLVLNYDTEMAMLDQYPVKQTTFQLVHDDYNVGLAKKYGHIVDVFICHNTIIRQKLLELFPGREKDIFYLPHGVSIPDRYRLSDSAIRPLKPVFLGRMTSSKGIYDLPKIGKLLRQKGVAVEWTCIGNGPELSKFKGIWESDDVVHFPAPRTNDEVVKICAEQDVFVLPTKFEGSPVSLVETMSAGLVPVITDLPGGITDIVNKDIGFRVRIDDNTGFAAAIALLYCDRALLNKLSINCRRSVIENYNVKDTATRYHQLFLRHKFFYKHKIPRKMKVGARLDQPFIPSLITKTIRTIQQKLK